MATAKLELLADSRQVRTATSDLEQLNRVGSQSELVAGKASRGLGAVGKSAGQASIQLQQFIGQVQGGQSALVALSQQSADLGFVLGAPLLGALVSIGAAVGGMAFAALSGSEDVKTLEEAVKRLGDAVVISDDGVALLSAEIERLALVSRDAAMAQLAQEIIDAKNVITTSVRDINESFSGVSGAVAAASGAFALYRQAVDDGTAGMEGLSISALDVQSPIFRLQQLIAQLNSEFNLSSEQSLKLAEALYDVRDNGSAESIQNLQNTLSELNAQTGFTNEKLTKFSSGMGEAFSASRDAGQIIEAATGFLNNFDSALDNSTEKAVEFSDKTAQLTTQLRIQNMELQGLGLEAALYAAALATGKDSAEDLDEAVRELITDNYRLAESKRQVKVDAREQAEAQRELLRELRAEQEQIIKNRNERNKITGAFTDVQQGLAADLGGEAEQARQQLQARLDVIREYAAIEGADREAAMQAQLDAEMAFQQRINEINQQGLDTRLNADRAVQSQILSLTASSFGAIADVIENAKGKESAAYKVAFLAAKSAAIAQAVINTELAAVSALAPPPLGLGPVAGAPYATAVRALGYASIGIMAGQAIAGVRAQGGQVLGGNQYLVGERGPELVTMRGNGNVTPFNQLMRESSGGNVNVPIELNITMDSNAKNDSVSQRQIDDRRIIDVVVANGRNRGAVHKMITDTTTASNKI